MLTIVYDSVPGTDRSGARGQAGVLGFALLIGIVAIGVTTVLLVGGAGLADTQERVEVEQATQTMTLIDSQASTVALGENPVQSVSIDGLERSGTLQAEATGRLVVETDDGTTYVDQELGTLFYRNEGGEVVAYQGGGVWRGTGTESRMISPPEFHYRDGTLTLPIVVVNPDTSGASGDGRVTFTPNGSSLSLAPGVIENEILTITITSDYYVAWGGYFEERVDGVTVEYDHPADTVEITLAELDIDGDYRTGVVAAGDVTVDNGNPEIRSEVISSGSVTGEVTCNGGSDSGSDCITEGVSVDNTPLDMAIERLMVESEANDPAANIGNGPQTLTAGSYYTEGFGLSNGPLTIDLEDGNVTLFVDGNFSLNNNRIDVINAENTNHYAKVFTTGDVAIAKGQAGVTVDGGNATRFQLFGTSEMHFGMGQSNTNGYTGTVYAPRSEPAEGSNEAVIEHGLSSVSCASTDVCIGTGSGTVEGAINAGPVSVQQSSDFEYAEELESFEPSLPAGAMLPPPITFLHVSANRIDVAGVPGSEGVSLQTATPTPTSDDPSADSLTVTADGAKLDISADLSDPIGDSDELEEVDITVVKKSSGDVKYEETISVSGDSDSVSDTTDELEHDVAYEVTVTISDSDGGDSDSETESATTESDTGDGDAPDHDPSGDITGTSPNGNQYEVSYSATASEDDLADVTLKLTYEKSNGNVKTKSDTVGLSGEDESGTMTLSLGSYDEVTQVDLTVRDEDGNTGTDTESNPN
jgi:hypothetical protein